MVRISARAFDRVLHEVIEGLPDEFRRVIDRVPVVVDPQPSRALVEDDEEAAELLGLFVGPPLAEWDLAEGPPETAVIYLFHDNLEDAAATRRELAAQIRITLLHELGHALGFDEDDLDRMGLG